MQKRSLKARMRAGEVCVGTHTYSASSANVEIIGRAGFDWVIVDCEHAPVEPGSLLLQDLVRAAELSGATPLVRVPENDDSMIMKVLDAGAAGVVVPHINDAESARRAVEATRYAPSGIRSACTNTRATGFYSRFKQEGEAFWSRMNEEVLTVFMLEDQKAVDNIEEILSVPGIDVAYLGPRDLAMSMGEKDIDGPRVREAIAHMSKVALDKGILLGRVFYYPDIASAAEMVRDGATFLGCTSDIRIFFEACHQITDGVKNGLRVAPGEVRA